MYGLNNLKIVFKLLCCTSVVRVTDKILYTNEKYSTFYGAHYMKYVKSPKLKTIKTDVNNRLQYTRSTTICEISKISIPYKNTH